MMDLPQITNAARDEATNLIIIPGDFHMASHFWQADPMGKLIRHAPCPVLVASHGGFPSAWDQNTGGPDKIQAGRQAPKTWPLSKS
jgi:hypothetical protein